MYKGNGFNLIFCLPKEKVAAIFAGTFLMVTVGGFVWMFCLCLIIQAGV